MNDECSVILLEEKDTGLIFELITQKKIRKEQPFVEYINGCINFDDYYSQKSIRLRKINFQEEWVVFKGSNHDVLGFVSFNIKYFSPVLIINLIFFYKNNIPQFINGFKKAIEILKKNIVFEFTKIRISVSDKEYEFMSSILSELGFYIEARRRSEGDYSKQYIDYVLLL